MYRIALVKTFVMVQQFLPVCCVLVSTQHGT